MSAFIHASTSFLRSRSQFLTLIDRIHEISKGGALLYALSSNAPDLERSVRRISACAKETIGCLSAPIQNPIAEANESSFSCSVAILDENHCRPFSTLKTGEGPLQVGRWHSFRKKDDTQGIAMLDSGSQVDWEDVWNQKSTSVSLPIELSGSTDSQAFLYFCDSSARDFAKALHENSPQAYQLGISASSTPFVTGLPFTLLRNGKPQSSGAVGVSLNLPPTKDKVSYSGLIQLTRSLPVRRAEGNLIHALGESLPARILLNAIEEHGLPGDQSKEADYYVGLRDATERETVPPKMHRIIAGDPSRGSIAIEDVAAPPVGSLVEFYYRPKNAINQLPSGLFRLPPEQNGLSNVLFSAFIDNTILDVRIDTESTISNSSDIIQHNDTFLVSTENGFVFGGDRGQDTRGPWKCTVPGAFGGLCFQKK